MSDECTAPAVIYTQSMPFFLPTEEGPFGSVQKAKQHVFGWCELHNQPHKGRVHLYHFKQHGCTA